MSDSKTYYMSTLNVSDTCIGKSLLSSRGENPDIDFIYISNDWDKGRLFSQWEKDYLVNGFRQLTNHCGRSKIRVVLLHLLLHQSKSHGSSIYIKNRIMKLMAKVLKENYLIVGKCLHQIYWGRVDKIMYT